MCDDEMWQIMLLQCMHIMTYCSTAMRRIKGSSFLSTKTLVFRGESTKSEKWRKGRPSFEKGGLAQKGGRGLIRKGYLMEL